MLPTVLVLIGLIVVGVIIARRGPAQLNFRTAPAALGTVTQTVDVTGTLQPSNETDLDFGFNGHVDAVNVQAGQQVQAGTVLATLDPEQANAALVQAQQAYDAALSKEKQDAAGSLNVTEQQQVAEVNANKSQLGPDQSNYNDTVNSGKAAVAGAQITLQTALAADQGLITQDQQAVTADTAILNDAKTADAAQVAAAQAAVVQAETAVSQTEAQEEQAVNGDRSTVNTDEANQNAQERVDEAAINADQTLLANDETAVSDDNTLVATDQATLAAESDCNPVPVGNTTCPTDLAALKQDQEKLGQDQATTIVEQGKLQQDEATLKGDQETSQAQIDAAKQALNDAENQADADVANAKAAAANAEATAATDAANALKDSDTNQGTLNDSLVQLQNAKVAYTSTQANDSNQIAQASTNASKDNDSALGQLQEADANLQGSLSELYALTNGQIPQTVIQDQTQVDADQVAVKSSQDNVNGTQLIAPVSGTLEEVNIAVGEPIGSAASSAGALAASAASGQPTSGNNAEGNLTHAIVMITPQAFQVSGPVSDAQLPQVQVGDQVNVVPAGGGDQLLGHVTGIAPSALITQGVATFTVTAVIDGVNPEVHAGSTAQMSIVVERDVDVLTVPTSAVHTVGASSFVYVPVNGQEVVRPVTIGASDPSRTQILSGLNKNDQVVLAEVGAQPPTGGAPTGGGVRGAGGGGGGGGR